VTFTFRPLADHRALLNGDMALLPHEVNPFIAKLISEGLVFQAYHQHLIEMSPQLLCAHLVFRHGFQILTSCDFLIASS
jgi:hypothetical protein